MVWAQLILTSSLSTTRRNNELKKKLLFFLFALLPFTAHAWFRLGVGATPTFLNTGETAQGISVTISSVTASLLYLGNRNDREILLQNSSSLYSIYIGTFSSVKYNSGPRVKIPANSSFVTDNTNSLYGIVDSTAGASTVEVLGWVEYDLKDR